MKKSLTNIKSDLFNKIEFELDLAFNEVLNELTNKLAYKRFITKKYIVEEFEAADKILDTILKENASKWFEFIAEELCRSQIVMKSSHGIDEIEEIIRAEQISYINLDGIISEVIKEERQSEYLKYTSNLMIANPSKLSSLLTASSSYLNPQYRINSIKSVLDNHKLYYRIVIQRRFDEMFKKIQNLCNDDV